MTVGGRQNSDFRPFSHAEPVMNFGSQTTTRSILSAPAWKASDSQVWPYLRTRKEPPLFRTSSSAILSVFSVHRPVRTLAGSTRQTNKVTGGFSGLPAPVRCLTGYSAYPSARAIRRAHAPSINLNYGGRLHNDSRRKASVRRPFDLRRWHLS